MTIRSGKRLPRNHVPSDLRRRLQGTGFVMLAEAPGDELVIGVAGQFWRPDGGRCLDLTADEFAGFSRPGYAKGAWNFKLRAESPESSLVGPFSGLMRKAILKQIKTEVESKANPHRSAELK